MPITGTSSPIFFSRTPHHICRFFEREAGLAETVMSYESLNGYIHLFHFGNTKRSPSEYPMNSSTSSGSSIWDGKLFDEYENDMWK